MVNYLCLGKTIFGEHPTHFVHSRDPFSSDISALFEPSVTGIVAAAQSQQREASEAITVSMDNRIIRPNTDNGAHCNDRAHF